MRMSFQFLTMEEGQRTFLATSHSLVYICLLKLYYIYNYKKPGRYLTSGVHLTRSRSHGRALPPERIQM